MNGGRGSAVTRSGGSARAVSDNAGLATRRCIRISDVIIGRRARARPSFRPSEIDIGGRSAVHALDDDVYWRHPHPLFTPPTTAAVPRKWSTVKGNGGCGRLDELRILNGKKANERVSRTCEVKRKNWFFTDVYVNTICDLRQWSWPIYTRFRRKPTETGWRSQTSFTSIVKRNSRKNVIFFHQLLWRRF